MRTIVPKASSCNTVVGVNPSGAFCVTLLRQDAAGNTQLSQHGHFAVRDDAEYAGSLIAPWLNDVARSRKTFDDDDVQLVERRAVAALDLRLAGQCPACRHDFANAYRAPTNAALWVAFDGQGTSGGRFPSLEGPLLIFCVRHRAGLQMWGELEDRQRNRTRVEIAPGLVVPEGSVLWLGDYATVYFRRVH
jgi:hypothetical protein